jgi:hypothetical protein
VSNLRSVVYSDTHRILRSFGRETALANS